MIIQTNFDRLTERALQDAGIEPLVIASADDAKNAPPLHTVRVVVVKVNGDRLSPNLKNTLLELEAYEPELTSLLSRILSEYGLIVCGWSGDWDPALRNLIEGNQPRIFSTFWAHRGEPSEKAQELIKARTAITLPIEDADQFLEAIASKVAALHDLAQSRPSSAEVAVAELKRYMASDEHRIRLRDLVMDEVERAVAAVDPKVMPVEGSFGLEQYVARIRPIEDATGRLLQVLANLTFYGDEDRHDKLAMTATDRLANRPIERSGKVLFLNLQRYPALLALYAVGLGALATERPHPLLTILKTVETRDLSDAFPIAYGLAPHRILDYDALRATKNADRHRRATCCILLLDATLKPLSPMRRNTTVSLMTWNTCSVLLLWTLLMGDGDRSAASAGADPVAPEGESTTAF